MAKKNITLQVRAKEADRLRAENEMLVKDKAQLVERMSQVDEENAVRSEKEKVQHERVMVLLDENVCVTCFVSSPTSSTPVW